MEYLIILFLIPITYANLPLANTCGEVLDDGIGGGINYKVNTPYDEWENCIWTVKAGNKYKIQVRLLEDGFNANDTYKVQPMVNLYKLGPNLHSLEYVASIRLGDRDTYEVTGGPVFFIQFTTGQGNPGTGFSLLYEGVGSDDTYVRPFDMKFITDASSNLRYPIVKPSHTHEFSFATIVPTQGKAIKLNLLAPTVLMQAGGASSKYCYADVLAIYEFGSVQPRPVLSFCRSELERNYTIVSPSPILIAFDARFGYYADPNKDSRYQVEWENVDFPCSSGYFF
jgi:hypothetical protein